MRIILSAISNYNLGYTIQQTSVILAKKHHLKIPISTIHNWLKNYKPTCTFHLLRKTYLDPANLIKTRVFFHSQPYKFQYHSLKLQVTKNPLIISYIRRVHANHLPNVKNLKRASDICKTIRKPVRATKKINPASEFAKLALEISPSNKHRHSTIQNLMLINDSSTIATELPVYNTQLLGHIDILQYRFNQFYIMDYKPEIKRSSLHQALLYKQLLSACAKIPLANITAACFNENTYIEIKNCVTH